MCAGSHLLVAGLPEKIRSWASTEPRYGTRRMLVCVGLVSGSMIFQLFRDRTGPSVRNDQRQYGIVFGADVNENVNVQSVDSLSEVRQGLAISSSHLRQS